MVARPQACAPRGGNARSQTPALGQCPPRAREGAGTRDQDGEVERLNALPFRSHPRHCPELAFWSDAQALRDYLDGEGASVPSSPPAVPSRS